MSMFERVQHSVIVHADQYAAVNGGDRLASSMWIAGFMVGMLVGAREESGQDIIDIVESYAAQMPDPDEAMEALAHAAVGILGAKNAS